MFASLDLNILSCMSHQGHSQVFEGGFQKQYQVIMQSRGLGAQPPAAEKL